MRTDDEIAWMAPDIAALRFAAQKIIMLTSSLPRLYPAWVLANAQQLLAYTDTHYDYLRNLEQTP